MHDHQSNGHLVAMTLLQPLFIATITTTAPATVATRVETYLNINCSLSCTVLEWQTFTNLYHKTGVSNMEKLLTRLLSYRRFHEHTPQTSYVSCEIVTVVI